MARTPITGIAPSSWAPYFINGDASVFDDLAEGPSYKVRADKFAAWMGGPIVSCEDAGFHWTHDASQFDVGGADCQEYTALIEE